MSTSDSEEMHGFGDNPTPAPVEMHKGPAHISPNNNGSPTTTENTKNTKETEQADENFNSFHYWRPPLPDISGELEMLSCQATEEVVEKKHSKEEEEAEEVVAKDECPSNPGKATSDQIQKVLDCLQPHMDDPDVQGGYTESE